MLSAAARPLQPGAAGRVGTREAFPGTDTPVAVVVYVRDSGITAADARARPVRDPAAPTAELSRV